jgi:hypothetical protein
MGQIRTAPLKLPGSFGANTREEIANDQLFRFASVASNGVIDSTGRLVARKDFNRQTSGFTGTVEQLYAHRKANNTDDYYSVCAGKVYTGVTTMTERYSWAGTSTVLNSPQFASLTNKVYGFQAGIPPFCLNDSTYASETITGPTVAWTSPNCVIAAYGRLWVADDAAGNNRYTIWWSNLLDGKVFNAGDAGSLNLQSVWPRGQDSVVALAAAFGRLIVFGRNTILMYTLPADNNPADMTLTDVVSNTGCIARDSVVVTDDGVYFLSDNGIKRVDRLANVTSLITLPVISKLINEDVVATYAGETLTKVRAGYYPKEGWYVLNAPTANLCYVAATRQVVPQLEVPAFTTWTNVGMPFRAFAYSKDGDFYCAGTNGVFKYNSFTPDGANSAYNFEYMTQWLDFGDESRLKHFKYVTLALKAASGQTGTFRQRADYVDDDTSATAFTCDAVEFSENPGLGEVKIHIGRSNNVAKFGFSMPINGNGVELHALKAAATIGKTSFR